MRLHFPTSPQLCTFPYPRLSIVTAYSPIPTLWHHAQALLNEGRNLCQVRVQVPFSLWTLLVWLSFQVLNNRTSKPKAAGSLWSVDVQEHEVDCPGWAFVKGLRQIHNKNLKKDAVDLLLYTWLGGMLETRRVSRMERNCQLSSESETGEKLKDSENPPRRETETGEHGCASGFCLFVVMDYSLPPISRAVLSLVLRSYSTYLFVHPHLCCTLRRKCDP